MNWMVACVLGVLTVFAGGITWAMQPEQRAAKATRDRLDAADYRYDGGTIAVVWGKSPAAVAELTLKVSTEHNCRVATTVADSRTSILTQTLDCQPK